MDTGVIVLLVALGVGLVFLMGLFYLVPIGLWIAALSSGVRIGLPTLVGMRLRRVNPRGVVLPLITAHKAGLDLNANQMEAHFLAGRQRDCGGDRPHLRRPRQNHPDLGACNRH